MSIRAQSVSKTFSQPPVTALNGVTLEIREGEWVSITGKSGSGKSTLLYLLSTLDAPSSGDLSIDGFSPHQLGELELDAFRNRKMGFVFQFHYLIPELTVLENVLLPCRADGIQPQDETSARHWLTRFGLEKMEERLPGQLSGGEQQRVAIARALVRNPKYLFADEPTGSLDSQNAEAVMSIFRDVNRDLGTTIVMVTHDPEFASYGSRQIVLKDGALCSS